MSYSVKINCGGGAVGEWLADTGFAGGSTRSTTNTPSLAGLTNPAPLVVYQSARGDTGAGFSFTFSGLTVGKAYIVRLHFYEFEYANTNFRIGGVTKFSKDSSAGAAIGEFSFTASTASVTIECAIKDYQAWINGIELFAEPPPSDVTDLTAQAVSATHINLNWSPATDNIGVAQYRIERATNESFTQNLVSLDTGSTATSRAVTGLSADTHYYFRVKAIDADGNLSANWSNAASAETLSILDSYFERFELSKIFNINQLDLEMPILTADFGDGYAAGIIAGKSTGLRYWTISAELLPDLDETTIEFRLDGEVESDSRFNYFWEFYRRHLALGNKPFYFVDPRTSRKFLASFMDKRISFESITAKLYRGGVAIKQRRVKISGINFRADDGSVSN